MKAENSVLSRTNNILKFTNCVSIFLAAPFLKLKPPNNESSKCIPLHIPDPPHIVPSNIKATFVDTEEGLDALLVKLQDESLTEMAIDLENHSYRSFQGFGCLMQIT